MDYQELIVQIAQNLPKQVLGEKVLCAFSGGPDSMLLLYALNALAKQGLIQLKAAHFDHGIRKESAEEASIGAQYCQKLAVPFIGGKENVPAYAQKNKKSLELAARECRRRFLLDCANVQQCNIIALGHHADDQAETVLLNLIRGTGLLGLCAMPMLSLPWWRPFLPFSKEKLLNIANDLALPYVIDQSNDSDEFRRNRVRKLLLELKKENPVFSEQMFKSSCLFAQDEAFLQKQLESIYPALLKRNALDAKQLMALDRAMASRALRRFLQENGFEQDISFVHIQAIFNLLIAGKNAAIDLPKKRRGKLEYGLFFLEKQATKNSNDDVCIRLILPGETKTPWGIFDSRFLPTHPQSFKSPDANTVYLNEAVLQKACFRTRRAGDFFVPLGMKGRKKIKEEWIDRKIPKEQRNGPLLAINEKENEILWLVGCAIHEKCNGQNAKRIVKIRFIPYDSSC